MNYSTILTWFLIKILLAFVLICITIDILFPSPVDQNDDEKMHEKVPKMVAISRRYACINGVVLGNLINDLRSYISSDDLQCLKYARQLVLEQGREWNCMDTQLNIQGEYLDVSIISGSGNRQLNVFRDIRNENKIVYNYNQNYKMIGIRRSYSSITGVVLGDIIDELRFDITDTDRKILQAARQVVQEQAREWIWRDAQLDIHGQYVDISLTSGTRTNKFSVLLDGDDRIVAKCTFKDWQFWVFDTSDNLWKAINDGTAAKAVIDAFALGGAGNLLGAGAKMLSQKIQPAHIEYESKHKETDRNAKTVSSDGNQDGVTGFIKEAINIIGQILPRLRFTGKHW